MTEPGEDTTVQKVTKITLGRVDKWNDLNASTEEEGNKKFDEQTKKLWKEFAVHGVTGLDKATGEQTILNFTDLDGKVALGLLKLAGIDTTNTKYIAPSTNIEGRIHLDVGDRDGIVVEKDGKTVFFDHHSDKSGNTTSAAKLVYEGLTSVGLLKPEKYLDELVNFVTQMDNNTQPDKARLFSEFYRTVIGLQRFMQFDKLLVYFKAGRKPDGILDNGDLKWLGMEQRSLEQKKVVDESFVKLEELGNNGFVINTKNYGKVVVDIGKKLRAGFDAVQGGGYQSYIIWSPEESSFFITSTSPLDINLEQGVRVRGTMWIKPKHDKEPLKVTLKEILTQLSGSDFNPAGKLKEYLDQASTT